MIEIHWKEGPINICNALVDNDASRLTFIGEDNGPPLGVTHLWTGSPAASRVKLSLGI